MFNSFNNKSESRQVDEVRMLLEGSDQIEEFQFEMRYSGNPEY